MNIEVPNNRNLLPTSEQMNGSFRMNESELIVFTEDEDMQEIIYAHIIPSTVNLSYLHINAVSNEILKSRAISVERIQFCFFSFSCPAF